MMSLIKRIKWMSFGLTIMIIFMMFFGLFVPFNGHIKERNAENLITTIDTYEASINSFIRYSSLSAQISTSDTHNIHGINKYYNNEITFEALEIELKRRFNETLLWSNASYIERTVDDKLLDSINVKPFEVDFKLSFNEQRFIKSNDVTSYLVIYEPIIDEGTLLGHDLYYFNLTDYIGFHDVKGISFMLYGSLSEVSQVVKSCETRKIKDKMFYDSPEFAHMVGQIEDVYGFYLISADKNILVENLWQIYAILGIISVVIIILFVMFNSITIYYSKKELVKTNEKKEEYKKIADFDSLTSALSRSYFDRWKKTFSTNDEGNGWFASLIMIDIDNLKIINDTHGHLLGDDVLKEVGQKITSSLRSNDLFIRFGGDEFILILEDCPKDIAEKILLQIIAEIKEINHDMINVEISFGIELLKHGDNVAEVIHSADLKMYENKRSKKS